MQHWTPELTFGLNHPAQDQLISKLGGLPWGLAEDDWPDCKECGRPMQFLAQIKHEPPMIDLGYDDAVLHAFKCDFDTVCSFYEADAGCNSVFIRSENDLGVGLTSYPRQRIDEKAISGEATQLLELRLSSWSAFEDHLTAEFRSLFYDDDAHMVLDETDAYPKNFDDRFNTKAGPIPYWTANGPPERLERTNVFLQLAGDGLFFQGKSPSDEVLKADKAACRTVTKRTFLGKKYEEINPPHREDHPEMNGFFLRWANFCFDGTGFFFSEQREGETHYGLEIMR